MVSGPPGLASGRSGRAATTTGPPVHAAQRPLVPTDPFPGYARIPTIFSCSKDQGFSVNVSKCVATGQLRTSTQLIYESKWAKFALWCQQRELDPEQAPVSSACNFLLHLFEQEGLAPRFHRWLSLGDKLGLECLGCSLTDSYHVNQPLRSFRANRPRSAVKSQPHSPRPNASPLPSTGRSKPILPLSKNGFPAPTGLGQKARGHTRDRSQTNHVHGIVHHSRAAPLVSPQDPDDS